MNQKVNYNLISNPLKLILDERLRQMGEEGYSLEFDLINNPNGELANAAAVYSIDPMGGDASNIVKTLWPWSRSQLKIKCNGNTIDCIDGRIRDLSRAGALIMAELSRLLEIKKLRREKSDHLFK